MTHPPRLLLGAILLCFLNGTIAGGLLGDILKVSIDPPKPPDQAASQSATKVLTGAAILNGSAQVPAPLAATIHTPTSPAVKGAATAATLAYYEAYARALRGVENAEPLVVKASNEATVAYYKHYTMALGAAQQERQQALSQIEWQLTASKMIFWIVVAITASGVVFCWHQFLRPKRKRPNEAVADLELSASGVKISSPVLGVVVLALSLAFFYLYLQFVHPIRIVGEGVTQRELSTQNETAPKGVSDKNK